LLARLIFGDVGTTAYLQQSGGGSAPAWTGEQLVACIRDVTAAFRMTAGRFLLIYVAMFALLWFSPRTAQALHGSQTLSIAATAAAWITALIGHQVMAAYRARLETLFLNLESTGVDPLIFAPYRIPRAPVVFISLIFYLLSGGLSAAVWWL